MEELTTRVMAATGLDTATARKAIGIILTFLRKEGPAPEVERLVAAIPGSAAVMDAPAGGGLLGRLSGMMGGVMGLGQKLMAAGVSMNQMHPLGRELFAYGRERAGEDVIGPIVGSVPGLGQFV
ncbi:MAG: DUF2267 domain-containing protein [Methylorubrum populi]